MRAKALPVSNIARVLEIVCKIDEKPTPAHGKPLNIL